MIFKKREEKVNEQDKEHGTEREITIEQEEELGDAAAAAAKVKKLKAELEKCKAERAEFLDGWQRCKADSVNLRRDALISAERAGNRSRDALIESIIPALDSFDMAMTSETWKNLDANWRAGMENVRSQLLAALLNQGVQSFGEAGEDFDPARHEAVQEIAGDGKPGAIAQVIRKGYQLSKRVVRPAQVAIFAHSRESKE